jgi:prevent-host-death family protein
MGVAMERFQDRLRAMGTLIELTRIEGQTMARTVTATEAKKRLGALLRVVSQNGEEIIVENRREPAAVIVSFGDYQELQCLREERRRRELLEEFRKAMAAQAERNKDLSEEEAEELGIRAIQEIREERRSRGRRSN